MKLLIEFLREKVKRDQRNPENIEAEELHGYLCEFILSVKRKDGNDFEPSSLRGMFSLKAGMQISRQCHGRRCSV